MKKIYYYIYAVVLTLGLASCTKNADQEQPNNAGVARQISVWAQINDEATTKTSLSGNDAEGYHVLWSEGDEITVVDGWNSNFTLTEGAGTTHGRFVGTSETGDGTYNVFYSVGISTNSKTLLSTSQYKGDKVISSAPMAAKITISNGEATTTDFKNLCGLLRLTLKGSGNVSEIKIYADQALYGRFEIGPDGSAVITDSPYLDYITQRCENDAVLSSTGTDFYIPMPPNDYTGVKIEVTDFAGRTFTKTLKSDKSLNIARAKITPISFTVNFPSGRGKATINGQEVYVGWVQLWKDGPRFAKYNVGVTDGKEESLGGHYTWGGNIDGEYGPYNEGTYLSGDSDTATKLWGDNWRMPTYSEYYALYDHCTKSNDVTYTKEKVNDQVGYRFTGTGDYAVNSMFLPLAGQSGSGGLSLVNSYGYYWSSNQSDVHVASYFRLTPDKVAINSEDKSNCNSVRAVYEP